MGNYNVGDMIRLSRIAKKMTQEELSEGVCSVETLSRIENGKHKVKSDTYRQLMEKMYQITEKNYAVCVSRDMELIEEREYFEDAMAKHDFEKADFYMEQMKKLVGKDASTQRYIRRESTFLDYYMQRITAEQLVEALEELAEEVVPQYKKFLDSDVIYPFREQEITLLKRLAVAYGRIDEYPKSIKICEMLLRSLREGYMAEWESEELSIAANLSKYYGAVGNYRYSMELCEYILPKVRKYANAPIMTFVLGEMAWNMNEMIESGMEGEEKAEYCRKKYKQAYFVSAAASGELDKKVFSDLYETMFGEKIE